MNCPHCAATTTRKRAKKTLLGYTTFFCPHCQCTFNERTGTPFNYLEFPTDVVLQVILWRLRYKLSLRDLAEMFLGTYYYPSWQATDPFGWKGNYADPNIVPDHNLWISGTNNAPVPCWVGMGNSSRQARS